MSMFLSTDDYQITAMIYIRILNITQNQQLRVTISPRTDRLVTVYLPSLSVGFCMAAVIEGLRVGSTIEARRLSSGTFLSSSNKAAVIEI